MRALLLWLGLSPGRGEAAPPGAPARGPALRWFERLGTAIQVLMLFVVCAGGGAAGAVLADVAGTAFRSALAVVGVSAEPACRPAGRQWPQDAPQRA